jgi:NhaA family Na+:H+ antiporter
VKREMISGDLSDRALAVTPIAAAVGGMVAPALIYLAINSGSGGHPDGWAIPIATDVAFALGVLAVIGRMAPGPLRAFLLTVAIVDDIGTIAVIALFFSEGLALAWLAAAAGIALAVKLLHLVPVRSAAPYVALGVVLWLAVHESGVHATIAGVILGFLTPAQPLEPLRDEDLDGEPDSPLTQLESALHPWSAYLVLPLFALANAGVPLSAGSVGDVFTGALGLGIVCGLVIGKPLGLVAATAIAVKMTGAKLPASVDMAAVACLGFVAGIGFTVALFISGLALAPAQLDEAKTAILVASTLASVLAVAAFWLRRSVTT